MCQHGTTSGVSVLASRTVGERANVQRPSYCLLAPSRDGTIWLDFWEKLGEPYLQVEGGKDSVDHERPTRQPVRRTGLAGSALRVKRSRSCPGSVASFVDAFAPGVQSAALSVARGNGKTALLSGIAAATLDGPLAVPRGETVIVAASFEQARIAFDHVTGVHGR